MRKREYLQSNPDVLTSRQIEILEENSLHTDMDKLNARQSGGIKAIESAFNQIIPGNNNLTKSK